MEELENKFYDLLTDRFQSLAKILTDAESFDSAMDTNNDGQWKGSSMLYYGMNVAAYKQQGGRHIESIN